MVTYPRFEWPDRTHGRVIFHGVVKKQDRSTAGFFLLGTKHDWTFLRQSPLNRKIATNESHRSAPHFSSLTCLCRWATSADDTEREGVIRTRAEISRQTRRPNRGGVTLSY